MVLRKGKLYYRLYYLQGSAVERKADVASGSSYLNQSQLWHLNLGHMSDKGLSLLSKQNLLNGSPSTSIKHKTPFKVSYVVLRDRIFKLLHYADAEQNFLDEVIIENLRATLSAMLGLVQLSYPNKVDFYASRYFKSYEVQSTGYDMEHVFLCLFDYIKGFTCSIHHFKSSTTMTAEQLDDVLDSLHEDLQYYLSSIAKSAFRSMTEYEALQNICGYIRDFHELKLNGCIEPGIVEYVIPPFQLMADKIRHFCVVLLAGQLYVLYKMAGGKESEPDDFPRADVTLDRLLASLIPVELEVMHICHTNLKASKSAKVRRFIEKLLKASPSILREHLTRLEDHRVNFAANRSSDKNIHIMIEFLLVILTDMPKNFIHHDKLFDLLARVGAYTKEVFVLFSESEEKSRNKESTSETNLATLHLLENIKLLKRDLKYAYLKAPELSNLCFPMSDGPLFMNLLLINLNELLNSNAFSVALIKEEIGFVKEDLEIVRSFLGSVEQELNKDIWKRALDVAYEAKYAINSILARDNDLLHLIFSLPSAIERIKLIKEEFSNLAEKIPKNMGPIVLNSPNKPVENKLLKAGKTIVGFKEETDWIIEKLTSGSAELDVISIIGMPGLGKTTLAYKVYNDRSVISHFDSRAWCNVDQEYNRKMMFQKIYNQVTGSDEKFKEDTDVDDMLRKKLYGRRYLIVLDDLWDIASWDDLTRPLLQVAKGSRIILTSRKKEVALHVKRLSDPLNLRLLRSEESWEMLEKRVFREESCPAGLLDVGKDIAENCKGLPLVVDLIAGVIARRGKEKSEWLELLKDLNSFIFENGVEVMKVIQLSYEDLSDPLKLCFLYLGSYKKDEEIEVTELKNLWSAEGFVVQSEMKSVEKVMEDYLADLVSSSLVMVSEREYGTKVCHIHDLLHDFCLIKARNEKFFDLICSSAPSSSSSSSYLMPRQVNIHYAEHLPQYYKNIFLINSKKQWGSCKHLLSLKLTVDRLIRHPRQLRLLRVLNLDFNFIAVPDYLLDEMGTLVHLRFLKIKTMEVKALPSSFSNLLNLETLVVNNGRCPVAVEPVIWNLAKLRHVAIDSCVCADLDTNKPTVSAEDSKLENLRMLEGLRHYHSKGPDLFSKRFPNLQKLHCKIEEMWDPAKGYIYFPIFGSLNDLEELKVYGPNYSIFDEKSLHPNQILSFEHSSSYSYFPSSLKSFTLGTGFLTSNSLSTIARLPNIQELRLKMLLIQGREWNMRDDDTFENLKFLELERVHFSQWQVGEESFPVLEHLIFTKCKELKEIPSSFGDIDSLRFIKVIDSPQLEDSALKIEQYVEDMTGEDKLQVLVRSELNDEDVDEEDDEDEDDEDDQDEEDDNQSKISLKVEQYVEGFTGEDKFQFRVHEFYGEDLDEEEAEDEEEEDEGDEDEDEE